MVQQGATKARHRAIEEYLSDEIKTGRLAVGDRIPTIRAISQEYGVSKDTAYKAILALSHKGFLRGVQGQGTFVRDWRDSAGQPSEANSIAIVCARNDLSWHTQFLYAASDEAEMSGYHLTISPMDTGADCPVPPALRNGGTLGTLILGDLSDKQAGVLLEQDLPHLFVGNHRNTFGQPCVRLDMQDAAYRITKRLLELDRGPVWLIIEPTIKVHYSQELMNGYQQAILEHPDAPGSVHICRVRPYDNDVATLLQQMMVSGDGQFCMLGNYSYIRDSLKALQAQGIDARPPAVVIASRREHELVGADRMMRCEGSVALTAAEGVRQLIAHAQTAAPVTGKSYKLHIENVDDAACPMRFSWR